MRVAATACIHGNRTAFEAVLADVRRMAPDLILNGGDLVDCGSSQAWIIDRIRELEWPGVARNVARRVRPKIDGAAGGAVYGAIGAGPCQSRRSVAGPCDR